MHAQTLEGMHAQQLLLHQYSTYTSCSDQGVGAQLLIKGIAQSADAGPGGWVGLKRKLLHLDVDGSGAVDAGGGQPWNARQLAAVLHCPFAFIVTAQMM